MPYYTPLRYPGGKRRMVPCVSDLLEANGLKDIQYVEPYAGSAAVALAMLFEEFASVVHVNDLSRPVYAFWHSVLYNTSELCRRIERTKITMREWKRQRSIYEDRSAADLEELGFAALFLNRTNRSGIIGGGVIGGRPQDGTWSLDVRFNKVDLVRRIQKIARYKNRIRLYQMDALDFTRQVVAGMKKEAFVFYDPPYIENGKDLYLNDYTLDGHRELARHVTKLRGPWIVTYDYSAVRHGLYGGHRRIAYGLNYTAQGRYQGREVMFLSPGLGLPEEWTHSGTFLISSRSSRHPVYAMMETVKPEPEMIEGKEASKRFMSALKTVLSVPKSAVPNPFKKSPPKTKPTKRKS